MDISNIASAIAVSASLIGGAYFVEDRYVSNEDIGEHVVQVQQRLETIEFEIKTKIFKDQIWQINDRIYTLEDRLERHPERHNEIKRDIERLTQEKTNIQKKIEILTPQNARMQSM